MSTTDIEWADKVWNPTRGCSIVSPGCVNCYAMKQAHRFSGKGKAYEGLTKLTKAGPQWTGEVRTVPDMLTKPMRWKKPQRIFVNSMSDLFHEDVPFEFVDQVFAVMALSRRHTFIILTKRADRMRLYLTTGNRAQLVASAIVAVTSGFRNPLSPPAASSIIFGLKLSYETPPVGRWPLPNVHLYVSVENQQTADERIPLLLQTPAAVRGVSAEPLLGPVDFSELPSRYDNMDGEGECGRPLLRLNALRGGHRCGPGVFGPDTERLDHVIVGGESGPGARPCAVAWIRSILQQCQAADVPVFCKQLGANPNGDPRPPARINPETGARTRTVMEILEIRNRKGADPAEWPADLRVRELPR